jgi:hypothetical protein
MHRSEITDWRSWMKTVSELETLIRDGKPTVFSAQRNEYASWLSPAMELAKAEIAEAKELHRASVQAAETRHQEKVAQADRELLLGRRKVRANRRAAKNARNRVFKRFLETGNEQQAIEELKSLVGTLGLENTR